jgi:hypothetical protein
MESCLNLSDNELPLDEQLYDELFSTKERQTCKIDKERMARSLSRLMATLVQRGLLTAEDVTGLTQ